MKQVQSEKLLNVAEVAERLSLSMSETRRQISSGQIPSVLLGKRAIRVLPADLEAYIAARRRSKKKSTG